MNAALSLDELAHYHEHGYVFPRYRLPDPLLQRLRESLDRLLVSYTDVAQEDLANPHMLPLTGGSDMNPFMAAARHPPVLDMMEQFVGPDIVLCITPIFAKPPVN